MNRTPAFFVLALLVVACSVPESDASTTTSSTLAPTTSTTASPTTTTTTLPPSTTTTLLEGNWAEQPVITSANGGSTLGWWDGSQWVQVDEATQIPIQGGEEFQVALIEVEAGTVTALGPTIACGGIHGPEFELPGVELDDAEALSFFIPDDPSLRGSISGVAISAPWNIHPRPVERGEAHPDLEAMAAILLSQLGYQTDTARLVQTVDVDLDGDGAIETIVVAEDTELANSGSDVYSIVFVVKVGGVPPILVDSSVIPPGEGGFPASFRVGDAADLNGDGLMEIVLDGVAWENSWASVHELSDDGFARVLSAGCGV